jgi:hypothetical protein
MRYSASLIIFKSVDDARMYDLALGDIGPNDLSVDGLRVDEDNWP